ncbi:MAG TPA: hypothetical protein PKD45_01180 [Flavobacteriales bacterium]|nr:hypothetical protein [Flavobacteriales bacterium]
MTDTTAQFSAAESALGYLYQVRCALLWSLQRLKNSEIFSVSVETLDDVAFEKLGTPTDLLQTKHHLNRKGNLMNSSSDLWKTLRIWIELTNAGKLAKDTMLFLVTSETAQAASIAGKLKTKDRDVEGAMKGLLAVAQTSESATNESAYAAYKAWKPSQCRELLERVLVIDQAPDIEGVNSLLAAEVHYAAGKNNRETFVEYLEGWWFRRVIQQLLDTSLSSRILSEEIEAQVTEVRDRFRQDSLPVADDLLNFELDTDTAEAHKSLPFVKQVELATSHSKRLRAAIRDYFRAFEQRSRWLRQDLLFVADLTVYERALIEEWEAVFHQMEDTLGTGATEEVKKRAASDLLAWAEQGNQNSRIRPGVHDGFITRGSLHILANDMRIGWHPEFKDRLASILS